MKHVMKTVARLLMRVARHRAEQYIQRQRQVNANLAVDYRSNAGGWN